MFGINQTTVLYFKINILMAPIYSSNEVYLLEFCSDVARKQRAGRVHLFSDHTPVPMVSVSEPL